MSKSVWLMMVAVALTAAGCRAPGPGKESLTDHRSTVIIDAAVEPVLVNKPYTTDKIVRLRLEHGPLQWTMIAGPNPGGPPAQFTIKNTVPCVLLGEGWIYIYGRWGCAMTDRISATAHGTSFVLQKEGDTHRAFLLSGNALKVIVDGDANNFERLTAVNTYVELAPAATALTPPAPIPPPPHPVGQFIEYVLFSLEIVNP